MNKNRFSSLWPWKWNENGMEMEIQTNVTETFVGINFCGGVHENAFVCIALTGPQRSKTIKLRETSSVFCFLRPKTVKKTWQNHAYIFAWSLRSRRCGQRKCSNRYAGTCLNWSMYKRCRAFLSTASLSGKRAKKRIETAILMVNLDHLEPATRTSMYKAWN